MGMTEGAAMFRRGAGGAAATRTERPADSEDHEGGQAAPRGISAGAAMHAAGKLTRTGPTRDTDTE